MFFIKNPTLKKIEDDLYAVIGEGSNGHWIEIPWYKGGDLKEIFIESVVNIKTGRMSSFGLCSLQSLRQFLHLVEKTKGIGRKKLAYLSNLEEKERLDIVKGLTKAPGFGPSIKKKLEEPGLILVDLWISQEEYSKLKGKMKKLIKEEELIERLIKEKWEELSKMGDSCLKQFILKTII